MSSNGDSVYTTKEILEKIVIPRLDKIADAVEARDARLDKLEASHDRFRGALMLVTALLVPIAIPIVLTVLQGLRLS